jgi:replication factor C small subunit
MGKIIRQPETLPWSEKYRPQSLDEIRGNPDQIEGLKRFALNPGGMPHICLAGPPGNGKTSAALCLAHQINATAEKMNASNERNLHIIQGKVLEYATTASLDGRRFKVLIMDESDRLTGDAQNALKAIMEDATVSCRFFMVANDLDGIIKPIRSRCAVFYFDPLPDEDVKWTLGQILDAEGYEMEEEAGDLIVRRSMGDLRSAVNTLQMVCDGTGRFGTIGVDDVRTMLGTAAVDGVGPIIDQAVTGRFEEAMREYHSRFKGYAGAQDFSEMVTRDLIQGKFMDMSKRVALNLPYLQMGGGRNDYLVAMGFLARLSEN